jgi:hypothetical protein
MEWEFNNVTVCDKCRFYCGDNDHSNMSCPYTEGWKDGQQKMAAYLFETCPHTDDDLGGDGVTMCYRHACGICMKEIQELTNGK